MYNRKVDGSKFKVAGFLAGCRLLMRTLLISFYSEKQNDGLQRSEVQSHLCQNFWIFWPIDACAPSQNFDFCTCPSHNALNRDAGGKKGKLLCCKCIFDWIKGNLAKIQPKNHQNVQKTHFLQKVPGVNGLISFEFEGLAM